ncbi:hypothetical protein P7H21_14885 [Paenibacillus larvae]|nr:hypothetical protein [Paenibacillus larvae]MDT2304971.1 hypothetical protein [Paenibacillus larvae]
MKTLYELKQILATIGQQLQKTESDLAAKAVDPWHYDGSYSSPAKIKEDLKMR